MPCANLACMYIHIRYVDEFSEAHFCSALIGKKSQRKLPHLTWRFATELVIQASAGRARAKLSRMWRTVEQKARLIDRFTLGNSKSEYQERFVLASIVRSLYTAHLDPPPTATDEVALVFHSWARALWNVVYTSQAHAAESSGAMASAKAKKVETAIRG